RERPVRPLAVEDLVRVLEAALVEGSLSRMTVSLTGPEQLPLSEAVRRVARVLNKPTLIIAAPIWFHYLLAQLSEWTMKVPLVAKAQVRILSEGVIEPATSCDALPDA